ncbi:MAG: hypothetical protein ACR2NZ_06095 [Rubripirellula sp.]
MDRRGSPRPDVRSGLIFQLSLAFLLIAGCQKPSDTNVAPQSSGEPSNASLNSESQTNNLATAKPSPPPSGSTEQVQPAETLAGSDASKTSEMTNFSGDTMPEQRKEEVSEGDPVASIEATPGDDTVGREQPADTPDDDSLPVDLSDAVRLLLPTTAGPLVVAVDLKIGDESSQQAFERRVRQVMEQASDGKDLTWPMLFEHVASDAQQFGRMPINSNQYQNMIRVYDKNRNKRPDDDEVAKFLFRSSGFTVPFRLVGSNHFRDVNRSQSNLFKAFDRNDNRRIEPQEMELAADSLLRLDVDGDRRITVSEVVDPQQNEDAWQSRRSSRWGEVAMDISGYIDWTMLAYTLDETLRHGVYGAAKNSIARLDRDDDGLISGEEAKQLATVEPDIAIHVQYGSKVNGTPEVKVLKLSDDIRDAVDVVMDGSTVGLLGDGLQLIVRATDVGAPPNRIPPEAFAALDANNDGGLDESEIPDGAFTDYSFEDLDANGDEKLTLSEIREGMIPNAPIWGVQIRGRGAESPDGVFTWLDQDRDHVLSEREIAQVVDRLHSIDSAKHHNSNSVTDDNQSDTIRALDIPDTFVLHFTRGDPSQNEQLFQVNDSSQQTPRPWPRWAESMDINRDGDISRAEFLGHAEQFRELDANGDGFIHADEFE